MAVNDVTVDDGENSKWHEDTPTVTQKLHQSDKTRTAEQEDGSVEYEPSRDQHLTRIDGPDIHKTSREEKSGTYEERTGLEVERNTSSWRDSACSHTGHENG